MAGVCSMRFAGLALWRLVLCGLLRSQMHAGALRADSDTVQVAVAADKHTIGVVRALLSSASAHSPNTAVHVIHAEDTSSSCQELVTSGLQSVARCVLWASSDIARVSSLIRVVSGQNSSACAGLEGCDTTRAKRLSNSFNFARFFLSEILPDLDRVIWMDCDVIISKDMGPVWNQFRRSDTLVTAFVEPVRFGRFYLQQDAVVGLIEARFPRLRLDMEAESFNDGVIGVNLKSWREHNVQDVLLWLMHAHSRSETGLWKYGTQPIMMLLGTVFGWERLPGSFCYGDLGFQQAVPALLKQAVFLHFNGERKPWKAGGINKHLWEPYFHGQTSSLAIGITL
mmetsp:Transcript_73949/g.128278  ORF Transcript_73949/g.128278 Transcript_73949/m.128278 type:complete len:340 (-) Transcript_73949:183-1202(-)